MSDTGTDRQLAPWLTLLGAGIALVALLVRVSRATVWLARVLAALVIISAVVGVWRHFDENYSTATLDVDYGDRWGTMSTGDRLWEVSIGSVGHAPIPAAGALVPIGVALAAATIGLGASVPAGKEPNCREQ